MEYFEDSLAASESVPQDADDKNPALLAFLDTMCKNCKRVADEIEALTKNVLYMTMPFQELQGDPPVG